MNQICRLQAEARREVPAAPTDVTRHVLHPGRAARGHEQVPCAADLRARPGEPGPCGELEERRVEEREPLRPGRRRREPVQQRTRAAADELAEVHDVAPERSRGRPEQHAGAEPGQPHLQTGLGGGETTTTTLPPIAIEPLPESALLGEQLFLGQAAFEAGGPACAACHTAGRFGDLAPRPAALGSDLTDLWERSGGADGFVATLTDPAYLAVHTAYRDAAPSADEVTALASFFAEGVGEQRSEFLDSLLLLGAAGLFALIAMTAFVAAARRDREEAR